MCAYVHTRAPQIYGTQEAAKRLRLIYHAKPRKWIEYGILKGGENFTERQEERMSGEQSAFCHAKNLSDTESYFS